MKTPGRNWLKSAAAASFAASLLHLACIVGGGDWYRFFGADETMARLAEAGSWRPAILTLFIAVVLFGWGLYALSGAGLLRRLPFLRTALVAIAVVLFARAVFAFFPATWGPELGLRFMAISSAIVGVMGFLFAVGTAQAWPTLKKVRT
ncbi:MAG: hypothetical protein WBA68_01450 [Alteraurantiacibacter sp.]